MRMVCWITYEKIFRDEMKISSFFWYKMTKVIKMYKNSEKFLENLQKIIEKAFKSITIQLRENAL